MDNRWYLLIDSILYERNCFRRKSLSQRGVTVCEIVEATRNEITNFLFETLFVDQTLHAFLNSFHDCVQRLCAYQFTYPSFKNFVRLLRKKTSDSYVFLSFLSPWGDASAKPVLERGDGVEYGSAS